MDWQIPLSDTSIGKEEIDAVTEVINSGWLTMGSVTYEFEKKFAEKMNVKYAFAVTNATSALHIANIVCGIKKNDEVICPYLTFVASANASMYCGADVVFADVVSVNDLTVDVESIKKALTDKTKAITVVHYGGFACNMDEIKQLADSRNIKIIEDCSHAPFAQTNVNGKKQFVGTIGDVGCFSFFGNKNMTTGEGGMVVTNNDKIAEEIKLIRSHGMTSLSFDRFKGHSNQYDVVRLGYNYRSDDLKSAIGLAQLNKIDQFNKKRRELYYQYIKKLETIENIVVPFSDRDFEDSTCHVMSIVIQERYEKIKQALLEKKIQTSRHYIPIPEFNVYKEARIYINKPFINNLITLPLYPSMEIEQVGYICEIIKNS